MSLCVMCNKELTWVKGFEGEYIITSNGKIFCSIDNKRMLKSTPTIKKTKVDKYGYERVMLYKNQKKYCKQVHRLVAENFIPNPNNLPQVNHIDGNKLNNNVNNLEWVSSSENIKHAYDKKLRNDKYKVGQYDKNGLLLNIYESELEALKKTKIRHINEATRGIRKTAGGYIWKRLVDNVE